MEGFLELRIDPVLRAFLTRSAAIVPSLLVVLIAGDEYAEFLIVVSSVILFVQLPYALIPLVKFCGDPGIAGPLALDLKTARATRVLCFAVVLANVILLVQMIHESRAVNEPPEACSWGSSSRSRRWRTWGASRGSRAARVAEPRDARREAHARRARRARRAPRRRGRREDRRRGDRRRGSRRRRSRRRRSRRPGDARCRVGVSSGHAAAFPGRGREPSLALYLDMHLT